MNFLHPFLFLHFFHHFTLNNRFMKFFNNNCMLFHHHFIRIDFTHFPFATKYLCNQKNHELPVRYLFNLKNLDSIRSY